MLNCSSKAPMNSNVPMPSESSAGPDRLKALAANTSTVIWHTAADGRVNEGNISWATFTGQREAEYSGFGWLDAVHPEDRPAVAETWSAAIAGQALFEFSYRLRRHDGEYRVMQAQGTPVVDAGTVREWVGVCVDITAARQAEAALRESELRLRFLDRLGEATRALTDAVEVMTVTARLLGEYLGATRCAYADVEADSNRFTIRNDWTAEGVPSSAGVYSLDLFGPRATLNLRRGQHMVLRDVDRELGNDGGARMFNAIGIKAIICAGLVKQGQLVAMMAVHQATPRDWTSADVALVAEVVDRSWAHIERVRSRAMLREQDIRKDEFLATLAHELRNPLAPIKYALALLRRSTDAARVANAQDVIDRQVTQMARLIDDLLDLSRVNRGLIQLQLEDTPLDGVLLQAVEVARPAVEEARHDLQVVLPPPDVRVNADTTRLVQVIGNLLGNAAKYTPDGGRIRLSAFRSGDEAVIEVADNGIGIPPEQQGQLFQMFSQLRHSAARAKGGLGIGLSLVRTLVQMHGGSVSVASAGLDEGSTFTVRLPLVRAVAAIEPPAAVPAVPAVPAMPAAPHPARPRVLVVEDNRDGRESLVTLLEVLGYAVDSAGDGGEAVEVARRFEPDVVLLDLGLPVQDGYAVCRALRADPRLRSARIIALTGWGTELDRQKTAQAGFDAHLTKPVEPDALQACMVRPEATPAA